MCPTGRRAAASPRPNPAHTTGRPPRPRPARRPGVRTPLKIVESLAAGVPVVTGDVGDRAEVLGPAAGLLVRPGDARALAGGIAELLEHRSLQLRLAAGARQRAEAYRWDRLARVW